MPTTPIASRVATQTPLKSTPKNTPPVTDSPGTWRHPRLDEIARRRNATTFSDKNVRRIFWSVLAIVGIWAVQVGLRYFIGPELIKGPTRTYLGWARLALQSIPLVNIGFAVLPLLRPNDNLDDIPLTAAQRKLLGLPAGSKPSTPNATYSTPPRYSRTPSLAGSVASNRSYTSSPLSGRGSPIKSGGSPFSPANNSPSKFANSIANRRSSFGSPTPFAASTASSLFPDTTPSPLAGKRTSVGLNNKWLYERGRRSSGGTWLQ
ncbi:nuclear pore complex component [Sodiomyces alkalinus F11]|uniref:Nuclear pore complex component n=1 Tax=Sodiomyces alkalinus (strain CBS 110278 / VKM F-3762 / F11) TaxID=1314773 RepID=A0A3N2PY34_SODAK|nr:nuclear pore complex component [Sodiomyces alkalinus F11]ROT39255.1 nuclear pore complex component [Sodiomyces alkalinus F11]